VIANQIVPFHATFDQAQLPGNVISVQVLPLLSEYAPLFVLSATATSREPLLAIACQALAAGKFDLTAQAKLAIGTALPLALEALDVPAALVAVTVNV
jgi:hypothetical protein